MSTSLEVQQAFSGMQEYEKPVINTPMALLRLAIENNTAIDVIERLAALQREERDYRAKSAYFTAFTEFKKHLPRIEKTRKILDKNGSLRSMYAALEDICSVVVPLLFNLGITHRYRTRTEADGRTTVTCFLRHVDGYEEEGASMSGAPDTSGNKTPIQADGSTASYLERRTLVASLGIPIYGQDTDGNKAEEVVSQDQGADWVSKIEECSTAEEVMRAWTGAVEVAKKINDYKAMTIFTEARDKRLKEIKRGSR